MHAALLLQLDPLSSGLIYPTCHNQARAPSSYVAMVARSARGLGSHVVWHVGWERDTICKLGIRSGPTGIGAVK